MKQFLFFALLTAFFAVTAAQAQTTTASARIVRTPPQRLVKFLFETDEGRENLRKGYAGDLKAAAQDLLVKSTDIDRNGTLEYLVSRKSVCRNVDCAVTLYQQKGGTFVALLTAPRLDVNAGYSEGKRNLISCESASAPTTAARCSFYRWYKGQYARYRCVEAKSKESGLKAKDIPCSEIK